MKKVSLISKVFKLPLSEQLLCFKVFFLAAIYRLIILIIPFRKIAKRLIKEIQTSESATALSRAKRIGQIIDSVCRHTPWESKCLVQALICKRLCRQIKLVTTLYIGVNKKPGSELEAHAWVVDRDNNIIVGGIHSLQFKVITTYSDVARNSNLTNRL